jgi:hypothetical protein
MNLHSCRIRVVLVASSALLSSLTFAPWLAAQGTTQILVATGDVAPATSDMFAGLSIPAMNNAGQVTFHATLTGAESNNEGIYRAGGGPTVQIARKGQSDGGLGSFSGFSHTEHPPLINHQGQVAFHGTTAVFGANRDIIFRGDGSSLTLIMVEGQAAPDGNGVFASFWEGSMVFNNIGQVGVIATLADTIEGDLDSRGIFRGDGNPVVQIARSNRPAPDGGRFNDCSFCLLGLSMNDMGELAFFARLWISDDPYTGTSDGVFLGAGQVVSIGFPETTQVIRDDNTPAPDGNGVITPNVGDRPQMNNFRDFVVHAWRRNTFGGAGDGVGLFRVSGATMTPIALEGQGAPGGGVFEHLYLGGYVALNDRGDVAFLASVDGIYDNPFYTGDDSIGMFLAAPDSSGLKLVMHDGQAAIDGNGIVNFGLDDVPALNTAGQMAIPVRLTETINPAVDRSALYLGDGVELIQVVRTGQTLAGSMITQLRFGVDSDASSSERMGLNDFSQVAYQAVLADGREVIALFTPDVRWREDIGGSWDNAANWTLSIPPAEVHKVRIDPASNLTVTGPTTHAAVKSLTVGGGAGLATLHLQPGGLLDAAGVVTIDVRGLLTGSGAMEGRLSVLRDGEIEVSAGHTIAISGGAASENRGRILLSGGTLNFLNHANIDAFINHPSALVVGQGTLRSNSRLTNRGLMLFNGTTNILGDLENAQGAFLATSGGTTTFFGDVINKSEIRTSAGGFSIFFGSVTGPGTFSGGGTVVMEGDLLPGASPAQINFGGDLVFGHASTVEIELGGTSPGTQYDRIEIAGAAELGGALDVTLIDGFAPGAGDSFEILRADEGIFGAFTTTSFPALSAGLDWNLIYSNFAVLLQVAAISLPGDHNGDGRVDAADFVVWRKSDGSQPGYHLWRTNFGRTAGGGSGDSTGSSNAVPEPSWMALLLCGAMLLCWPR